LQEDKVETQASKESPMIKAKKGSKVKIRYTAKLEDGRIVDTVKTPEPLEFKIGDGRVLPCFEESAVGMQEGDKETFKVPQAFGTRRREMIVYAEKKDFPEDVEPTIGKTVQLKDPNGNSLNAVIADVDESTVTLDANHPLAGKTVVFDIEMLEVS
jgi:FKBP-type peptidyl-prolyl cis-trans isomerase 2